MHAAIIVSSLVFLTSSGFGQRVVNPPTFDEASIKASLFLLGHGVISIGPTGLRGKNVTLKSLIVLAYRLQPHQVFGGPDWLDYDEYDIDAKTYEPASKEQLLLMLRALLGDRFRLSLHSETKELRVYELVIDKSGPKIHAEKDTETLSDGALCEPNRDDVDTCFFLVDIAAGPTVSRSWLTEQVPAHLRNFRGDLQHFTNLLSLQLSISVLGDPGTRGVASGSPVTVLDKTGLRGLYNISVGIQPDTGMDMFTLWQRVLQDQFGLKLESRQAKVEAFMVDAVFSFLHR